MEARVAYGPWEERPRLTVVNDGATTYSALPHVVMTDPRTQHGHIVTYAVLQMHWWQGGECWASHTTLAAEAKCSERQLRRYLKDLVAWEFITERMRGRGQAKAYAPADPTSQQDTGVHLNRTPVSASESNRTPVSEQADTDGRFNRTPVSDRRRRIEEDTYGSKKQESDVANAAHAPAAAEPKVKAESRARRLPEDWCLTDAHFEIASKHGFDAARTRLEGEKFSDHHRAHGKRMLDWMAAWRTWMRNAVTFDARRAPVQRNGATIPPGAASKQTSKWSDFKGRYGGNTIGSRPADGR